MQVRRRSSYFLGAGVQPPEDVQEQEAELTSLLGRLAFVSVGRQVCLNLRERYRRRRVRRVRGGEAQGEVARAFVLERLLRAVIADEAGEVGPDVLARVPTAHMQDPWPAFAILGAWRLRESTTEHVPIENLTTDTHLPDRLDLAPHRRKISPRRLARMVKQFHHVRNAQPNRMDVGEHKDNSPIGQVREAVKELLRPGKLQPRTHFWNALNVATKSIVSPYTSLPLQSKLSLCLALRTGLVKHTPVWNYDLDFLGDSLPRALLDDLKATAIAEWLESASSDCVRNFAMEAADAYAQGLAFDVWGELQFGMTAEVRPIPDVLVGVSRDVVLNRIDEFLCMASSRRDEMIVKSVRFEQVSIIDILKDIRDHASAYGWNTRAVSTTGLPGDISYKKTLNALMHGLPTEARSLARPLADSRFLTEFVSENLARVFNETDWQVAFLVDGWQLAEPSPLAGPILSARALAVDWGLGVDGAGKPEAAVIQVGPILARDPQDAARRARPLARAALAGIALLARHPGRTSISYRAIVRHSETNQIARVKIGPETRQSYIWRSGDWEGLVEQSRALLASWSNDEQRDLWQRASQALQLAQRAIEAEHPSDRYALLWFALEALVLGLRCDNSLPRRDVPLGHRAAYRAALILVPNPGMAGVTYGVFRWSVATELVNLYSVRNDVVHNGLQDPQVDEALLERFRQIVIAILWTVVFNGTRQRMTSIDEMLAWCAHTYRDTDPIV